MGKNNKKSNAFTVFMKEYKKIQAAKGHKYPGGLAEIQADPEFQKAWKNLSNDDKEYYKELAKENNNKRSSDGELIENIKNAKQREKEFEQNMLEDVFELVKRAKIEKTTPDIKIFVIHINYLYCIQECKTEYYPAEIAIGEFNLRDGVSRIYHTIVNETPKMGYRYSAKEHSSSTHQIPIEASFGKSNYCEIFGEICQFLGPKMRNGKYPTMYTLSLDEDLYSCVKSVLSKLAAASGESDEIFTLYSFEHFFVIMYKLINDPPVDFLHFDTVTAKIEIKKDPDEYRTDICCYYHQSLAYGQFCSQAIIQRWYSTLRKFCWNEH